MKLEIDKAKGTVATHPSWTGRTLALLQREATAASCSRP